MVHYGGLTIIESVIMASIVVFSSLSGMPSIVSLFRKGGHEFEAIISLFAILTSNMYHLCEVLDIDLYMSEEEWHRLDNVFAISGIGIYILHLSGNGHCRKTVYSTMMVSILTQEKDPWNVRYTFGPMILYFILSIILRTWYWGKVEVKYSFKRLIASMVCLGIGGKFFLGGLIEKNDYLRANHGMWHVMAGFAFYYGMSCTSWKDKKKEKRMIKENTEDVDEGYVEEEVLEADDLKILK